MREMKQRIATDNNCPSSRLVHDPEIEDKLSSLFQQGGMGAAQNRSGGAGGGGGGGGDVIQGGGFGQQVGGMVDQMEALDAAALAEMTQKVP